MTAVLYRRERELLNYVIQFQEQHGYSPILREMADAMNRNSVSTIHALIRSLVDKGYIQKVEGNSRTLKILKRDNIGILLGATPKTYTVLSGLIIAVGTGFDSEYSFPL